jgi:ComF family protein
MKRHAQLVRDFILDLIFPKECLGCGREGVWLCKKCFTKIPLNTELFCLGCNRPTDHGQICPYCQRHFFLDGIWVAADYKNEILANLIKIFKYHSAREIKDILGRLLLSCLHNLLINQTFLIDFVTKQKTSKRNLPMILADWPTNILLIPIPLHRRRQRRRGFNQAALLAEIISKKFSLPFSENQLIRIKHRKPQAKLKKIARQKNIQNCFRWQGENLNQTNIILIDDVTTTGATLNEAAKTLKQAGAGEVWGLVIAKG